MKRLARSMQSIWLLRNQDAIAVLYMLPINQQVSNTLTGPLITNVSYIMIV